jgi:hypothetical protein
MVPDIASNSADLPVTRFLSVYFVLMRFSDGNEVSLIDDPAALHGRPAESSA